MISDIAFQAAIDFQLGRLGSLKEAIEEALRRYDRQRSHAPADICSWCGADDDMPLVRPASGREAAICLWCIDTLYRRQILGEAPRARIPSSIAVALAAAIEAAGAAGRPAHAMPAGVQALMESEREERVLANVMATTRDVTPRQAENGADG